tara:strand:- start:368 stop:727 length:360 start_codon:yes stop_codon:yes gene_type:complete
MCLCCHKDDLALLPEVAKKQKMKRTYIKFRCSLFEKKLLRIKAKKSGLSLSEYCRRAALGDKIIERLTEEQIDIYKMLIQYATNFKLIGNMFRKRNPRLAEEVTKLAVEIRDHLKNFKK